MKITDVSKIKNKIVAFCIGDDIPMEETVSGVVTSNGSRLRVEKYDPNISFTGEKTALICFYDVTDTDSIPIGEAEII